MSDPTVRPRHEWRIDDAGSFSVLLDAHGDAPVFLGSFGGGAGCNPASITAADVGVVAWYAGELGVSIFTQSFAEFRATARRAWFELSENAADLARRAADPYEPEPFVDPWWAPTLGAAGPGYAAERAAAQAGEP